MRIEEKAERDSPIGDGALGVGRKRLLENLFGLAIPEGMLVAHGTVEAPLRHLVARSLEVNGSELRLALVLGKCRRDRTQ